MEINNHNSLHSYFYQQLLFSRIYPSWNPWQLSFFSGKLLIDFLLKYSLLLYCTFPQKGPSNT